MSKCEPHAFDAVGNCTLRIKDYSIRRVHEIIVAAVLAHSFEANLEEMSHPSKPLIITEVYQEGDGWYEWITRFENVAAVNDWSAAAKLNGAKYVYWLCITN